jgi:hypothetical protein
MASESVALLALLLGMMPDQTIGLRAQSVD